jgi:hypothetical protein
MAASDFAQRLRQVPDGPDMTLYLLQPHPRGGVIIQAVTVCPECRRILRTEP